MISIDGIRAKEYSRRLLLSRMRLLNRHPFFGLMLMHLGFSISEDIETAATNGEGIIFSPEFMDFLSDDELDFVLMHEVLHVALQHCLRGKEYDNSLFNIACDIVVNSNILKSYGMDKKAITLRAFGESMHLAPDGKEGYLYTAEQVYNMLIDMGKKPKQGSSSSGINRNTAKDGASGQSSSNDDGKGEGVESSAKDSGTFSKKKGKGSPDDVSSSGSGSFAAGISEAIDSLTEKNGTGALWDDHSPWGSLEAKELSDVLTKRLRDAATSVRIRDPKKERGLLPLCAERFLEELRAAENDWRIILANFIDEEICDYSFSPPDRRYDATGFFLPDFNDTEEKVEDILFMIDTSGSMSDEMISNCYAEIKGAIEQFDGHLRGWLGFFDAVVVEPISFESIEEFSVIRPKGGGGTRFDIIFDYVKNNMTDKPPKSVIILTDGYAPFPPEKDTRDMAVLWIINNRDVEPPYGKVARIS